MLRRLSFLLVLLCVAITAHPQEPASDTAADYPRHSHHTWHHGSGNDIVSIGHDSNLSSGDEAAAVVSILGSSTSDGDAGQVVSVLGNTRVTGHVGDSAVAVLGNTTVDGKVDGDVVAVLGNVNLGPHAEIDGDVVAVLGEVRRDPAAIVHGGVENVLAFGFWDIEWLHTWIKHCLVYGRPLAFAAGLGWAWSLALGFLVFYAALALVFRDALSRCVQTVEAHPGSTLLAALLALLLTPVLVVLLCVTLIGIVAVPFVVLALFCASLFGKAVMLAWAGHRVMPRPTSGRAGNPAFAVLIGGAVVLLLYVVPVLGFVVYNLLGLFGLGAVVYTLILSARTRQAAKAGSLGSSQSPGAAPPAYAAAAGTGATVSGAAAPSTAPPASAASLRGGEVPPDTATPPGGEVYQGAANSFGSETPQGGPNSPAGESAQDRATSPGREAPGPGGSPPHATAALPRAGFWVRMAALFLDVLLIGILVSMVHPFGHFHMLILAAYGAIMWKLRGSTVGGIVFDLRVVRLDGRDIDWATAIVRALGCFLSLAVVGLGFIWIAFDDDGQAWHDKIAGTVVVRVPKGVPLV